MNNRRTILITGGGTGIGLAMAQRFLAGDDTVIIVGRREAVLQKAVKELNRDTQERSSPRADYIAADLSRPDDVATLRKTLLDKRTTTIDVLINNAGGSIKASGDSLQDIAEQFMQNMTANLFSAVLTTEVLKDMLVLPGGRIINLSSIAALRGGGPAYSAAKAAVIGWSYALATELGPKQITVNVIAPGYVPGTEFFKDTMTTERHERLISQALLQKSGTPHDIANMAFFLASGEAAYITAQVFRVDGGALVR
jgi:3-oxoacyl-[acyl-carrier protein] reductase